MKNLTYIHADGAPGGQLLYGGTESGDGLTIIGNSAGSVTRLRLVAGAISYGLDIEPTAGHDFYINTITTDALNVGARFNQNSTGTVAAGFGTLFQFLLENDNGDLETAGDFGPLWTSAADGAERADMVFRTRGFEVMRLVDATNEGYIKASHSGIKVVDGVTAPTTEAGFAAIYVDSADGDLKVKFADGFVATIASDS